MGVPSGGSPTEGLQAVATGLTGTFLVASVLTGGATLFLAGMCYAGKEHLKLDGA